VKKHLHKILQKMLRTT